MMCECDGDGPKVYNHAAPKARKPYKCCECGRGIAAGEAYDKHWGIWDDGFNTFRWCAHCAAAQKVYETITGDHCFCFGGLWSGIRDALPGFGDVRDMAVYRLCVGAQRKWRCRRGSRRGELMPLPTAKEVAATAMAYVMDEDKCTREGD